MKRLSISRTIVLALALILYASVQIPAKGIDEAKTKLREFVPTLSTLEDKFPEDPQVSLGLAAIYSRHSPSFEYSKRSALLYRKTVALEPSNKAARVGMVKRIVSDFKSELGSLLSVLKMNQQYANAKNLQEVEILPSWSGVNGLYEWLHEEGQEKVVISDFNEARLRICEKFDHKLSPVIAELEKAEKFEPDNAVYNYLRAQLYFDLDKDEKGLDELEKGSRKLYFNTYIVEISTARKRVLQEAGFPENYVRTIDENIPLPWGIPGENKVFKIAKQEQQSGNLKKAKGIYDAIIRISNQYMEEPIPGKEGQAPRKQADRKLEHRFEKIARQKINEIQKEQNK